MKILGLSAYYHDSAAALVVDGEVRCAAQEERFSRIKHDAAFPAQAISWCLEEAGLSLNQLDRIVFYEKPLLTFERLLETYLATAPRGLRSFLKAMPVWLKEKLYLKSVLQRQLAELGDCSRRDLPALLFTEHHEAHAAAAYYPSPFDGAAVLCLDGVGEWACGSAWVGRGAELTPLWQLDFPHSLGLLYSAFTYYCGFKVNSGEYKLMGLAPYGQPRFVDQIRQQLLDVKPDGSFRLNQRYFNYASGLTMTAEPFHQLFGSPPRQPESPLEQRHMDLAASIQVVTEDLVLLLARSLQAETGLTNLCLAGGVALNCVANGRLLREGPFKSIWIQPAAGDAGSALGAALAVWHRYENQPRPSLDGTGLRDRQKGSYLGPGLDPQTTRAVLAEQGAVGKELPDRQLLPQLAELLAEGQVLGWCQGPMEFGPRALGGRSILGDARSPRMQSVMNLKIKYRESFRPFAPSVLAERVADWFELEPGQTSPYMLLVAGVRRQHRLGMSAEEENLFGIEKLNVPRSNIPAVTHVDYSARIQTVHQDTNPRYHALLSAFEARTGCPVLVNTSFNVRGEPIVCSAADAYRCFMRTEMDALVIGNTLLLKSEQPAWQESERWQESFALD
jgi:carbamoyltransferase